MDKLRQEEIKLTTIYARRLEQKIAQELEMFTRETQATINRINVVKSKDGDYYYKYAVGLDITI